jgi:fructan beta-fructosidase
MTHSVFAASSDKSCFSPRFFLHKSGRFLTFPVGSGETLHNLEIFCDGTHWTELLVPGGEALYRAAIPLPACGTVGLGGELPEGFCAAVGFSDVPEPPAPNRPLAHYAPPQGWCNDPNGLVYDNGAFRFCYQYNPCGTAWNNMSWGNASTRDFVRWDTDTPAMLPDARGSIFSGCAIRNERGLLGLPREALLYFYTAAGQAYAMEDKTRLWSAGKPFTQNWAYSLDGGRTICRPADNVVIGDLRCGARDPKVFWYAPKSWYCMVLFLDGFRFEVRHSADLLHWEKTQELELPGSWECPDLFALPTPDGGEKWVFWSADGYYYLGDFDGVYFHTDCCRHLAYRTALPYAAQTWSGTGSRVISIPWMRTKNPGQNYTGMYGVPREFELRRTGSGLVLRQPFAAEFAAALQPAGTLAAGETHSGDGGALLLRTECAAPTPVEWELFGLRCTYDPDAGVFCAAGARVYLGPARTDFTLLADRGILEITAADDTVLAALETDCYTLSGDVRFAAGAAAHTDLFTFAAEKEADR